jgi:hypothetical protein
MDHEPVTVRVHVKGIDVVDAFVVISGDGLDFEVHIGRENIAPEMEVLSAPAFVIGGGMKVEACF